MNQNVRESFSALMDNEGDDLEIRRALKALQGSPEEADTWRRYHLARSMMQRDRDVDVTTDLSAGIMARLADEPAPQEAPAPSTSRRAAPFSFAGSAAVAAAVSLMVITGVQVYNANVPGDGEGAEFASSDAATGQGGADAQRASLTSAPSGGAMVTPVGMGGGASGFLASSAGTGPVFPSLAPSAPGGRMEAGMDSPRFADPDRQSQRSGYQFQRSDYEQVLMLQAYLNQHADQFAGDGAGDAWMSSRSVSGGPEASERASQR